MKILRACLLMVTAALLLPGAALTQTDYSAEYYANGNGGVQTADREFMGRAVQEGMAKFQLAYLALQNAQSEEVKAYARQVLADYYSSQDALINIATQQFIALPTEPDAKAKATFDSLSQLQGEAFDKAYMRTMVKDQRTDLKQIKNEAGSGNNQAIVNWANQYLPALQSQSKQAEKVAYTVGAVSTENKDNAKSQSENSAPKAH